eukprot:TRINITY_DN1795_c2_g1_i2.p1 TRINITY_DN1795_c2_g1~~TRINITY_DN1795_c2_g1_i2.p1  ORF type:complete len:635 (+),score=122.29 TRINITY_DN1795_c2_g1_i2:60-1964(+)
MGETIALFVQDSRTKGNITLHTIAGCTVQEGGAVSKAFGQVPVKQHEGVCRVLHSYRCIYRIVNEVAIVGVVLGNEHTAHDTRQVVSHIASLLKTITGGKVTTSNLRRKYGELFLCLEEIIHQIGGSGELSKEVTDILCERPLVASDASMKLLYQKAADKQQVDSLAEGQRAAQAEAKQSKTLADIEFGFVANDSLEGQTEFNGLSQPVEFHPADEDHQLQSSILTEDVLASSTSMSGPASVSQPPPTDDVFSFMASPDQTASKEPAPVSVPEPSASGGAFDLSEIFGAADASPRKPPVATTVDLNDIISGGVTEPKPPEPEPVAEDPLPTLPPQPPSSPPPPVVPTQVKDYQLSILLQETVNAQLTQSEPVWSVTGDLLVLGRGTLLTEKEVSNTSITSSPEVTKDILFIRVRGHVEVKPNPSFVISQKTIDDTCTLIEVVVYQKIDVVPAERQSPVVLCKYRQKKNSKIDPPLMAKTSWESMCKPDQGESKILDQITLMWAVNPAVNVQRLSLAVNAATSYCSTDKQQSKPKGEWDDGSKILVWSPIIDSQPVLSSKLQARFQNLANDPPVTSEHLQRHKDSRHPVQVKMSGLGLLGVAQVTFHPTSDCTTPAVLAGGLQTKFSSGRGLIIV